MVYIYKEEPGEGGGVLEIGVVQCMVYKFPCFPFHMQLALSSSVYE